MNCVFRGICAEPRRNGALAHATYPVAWTGDTLHLVQFELELEMFWIFLVVVGLASLLIKLGALSVWVKLLNLVLVVMVVVAAVGGAVYLWRRLFRTG